MKKKDIFIIIASVLIAVLAVLATWMFKNGKFESTKENVTTTTTTQTSTIDPQKKEEVISAAYCSQAYRCFDDGNNDGKLTCLYLDEENNEKEVLCESPEKTEIEDTSIYCSQAIKCELVDEESGKALCNYCDGEDDYECNKQVICDVNLE